MTPVPIIKIEIDHMRQCLYQSFSEYQTQLDEQYKAALEQAFRPEIIQSILDAAASKYIKQALDEEVKAYFMYGLGREKIKKKVVEKLSEEY